MPIVLTSLIASSATSGSNDPSTRSKETRIPAHAAESRLISERKEWKLYIS